MELDTAIGNEPSAKTQAPASPGSPPGGRIRLGHSRGRPAIVMPRALFRGRMWLIFAFGTPFVVMPLFVDGGWGDFLPAIPLILIGLAIVGFGVFFACVRQQIVNDGPLLMVVIELFGRPIHFSTVLKDDIRSISIRPITKLEAKPDGYRGVHMDAGKEREFWLGTCLAPDELDWLRDMVQSWADERR